MSDVKYMVGLAGGMGAGKSTVLPVAHELGIPVFDYDAHVALAYEDEPFTRFLASALYMEPPITKAQVSQEIVRDPTKLPVVERCVMAYVERELQKVRDTNPRPFLLVDAPMLFEMALDVDCDFVISVLCPIEIRRERVMQRPNMTEAKMNLLMGKQLSEERRELQSNYVINNDGTVEEAQQTMEMILSSLQNWYKEL